MTSKRYTFCAIGLEDKETLIVNIVLKAFQENIKQVQNTDKLDKIDIALIEQSILSEYLSKLPKYTIILGESSLGALGFAQLEKPLRTKNLLDVLKSIIVNNQDATRSAKVEHIRPKKAEQAVFTPKKSSLLLKQILSLRNKTDAPVGLDFENYSLAINFKNNQFYIRNKRGELPVASIPGVLAKFASQQDKVCLTTPLSTALFRKEYRDHLFSKTQSLDKLLWILASETSVPIYEQSSETDFFHLKRLPNLVMFGASRNAVQLSSVLLKHTVSIPQLMQRMSLSKAQIVGFLNACYILGYLNVENNKLLPQVKKKYVNKHLIGSLRKRLGIDHDPNLILA